MRRLAGQEIRRRRAGLELKTRGRAGGGRAL
jgi:hypothetical protein